MPARYEIGRIVSAMFMAAVTLWMPQSANAAQVIATVTGTVTQGIDGQIGGSASSSIFGFPPGTDLTNFPVTVVYTLDTTGGIPFNAQSPCINGQESFLSTPVPKAEITINGRIYILGTSTPTTVDSYVQAYGAPASKPQNSLVFQFEDRGPSISRTEMLHTNISLNSLSQYVCRNWAEAFNYTLQQPSDQPSSGNFSVIIPGQTSGSSNQYAYADFNVQTVTVSGPGTAECFDAVSGAVSVSVGGLGGKRTWAKFAPKGGLAEAEKACGVTFNWRQYVEVFPADSPYYPFNSVLDYTRVTTLTLAGGAKITFRGFPVTPDGDDSASPYTAPTRFLDPQQGGYLIAKVKQQAFVYQKSNAYPFYLTSEELSEGYCFSDRPFDPFLPFNKSLLFTTLLVGIPNVKTANSDNDAAYFYSTDVNIYYSWQWESNNIDDDNRTAGGVTLLNLPRRTGNLGCPNNQ